MALFQLYRNANKATQKNYPYLLEVQSNLLSELRTTVAIPLMPKRLAAAHIITNLNPVIRIKRENFAVMTQNIAGIDRKVLGETVSDLSQFRNEIINAIDFVLTGI